MEQWIAQYGYLGIFSLLVLGIVGLPVPDETLLTLAGYLVYRGQLLLIPTVLAALLGSLCGITLSYSSGARRAICSSRNTARGCTSRWSGYTGFTTGFTG